MSEYADFVEELDSLLDGEEGVVKVFHNYTNDDDGLIWELNPPPKTNFEPYENIQFFTRGDKELKRVVIHRSYPHGSNSNKRIERRASLSEVIALAVVARRDLGESVISEEIALFAEELLQDRLSAIGALASSYNAIMLGSSFPE
jgi:hypothetical protein